MISFNDIPFPKETLSALSELKINYVFQSIFYPDGKTVYAREALMRPVDMNVTELIDKYTAKNELHTLEVATIFGASKAFYERGYSEIVSINSFPCECITEEEADIYTSYFNDKRSKFMIETLEYPEFDPVISAMKRKYISVYDNLMALDDYGSGLNTSQIAEFLKPDLIKLDRSLLTGIDTDENKQQNCNCIITEAHKRGVKIIAEGVETKEEFDFLKQLGADYFQGYYLAMPE